MRVAFFYMIIPPNSLENSDYYSDSGLYCPMFNIMDDDRFCIDDSNVRLYGFTDDKIIANIFEETHDPGMFVRKNKKMSRYKFKQLLESLDDIRLYQYNTIDLICNNKYLSDIEEYIIINNLELGCIEDEYSVILVEDIMGCTYSPYIQFKEKYIKALDLLLYCTYHHIYYGHEDEVAMYGENLSYGYTAEGFGMGIHERYDIMNIYLEIFKPLLRKDVFK